MKAKNESGVETWIYGEGFVPATSENIKRANEWARRIPLWNLASFGKRKSDTERWVLEFLSAAKSLAKEQAGDPESLLPPYPSSLAGACIVEELMLAMIEGDVLKIKRVADAVARVHLLLNQNAPADRRRAKFLEYIEANGTPGTLAETRRLMVECGVDANVDDKEVRRWMKDAGAQARGRGRPKKGQTSAKRRPR